MSPDVFNELLAEKNKNDLFQKEQERVLKEIPNQLVFNCGDDL